MSELVWNSEHYDDHLDDDVLEDEPCDCDECRKEVDHE